MLLLYDRAEEWPTFSISSSQISKFIAVTIHAADWPIRPRHVAAKYSTTPGPGPPILSLSLSTSAHPGNMSGPRIWIYKSHDHFVPLSVARSTHPQSSRVSISFCTETYCPSVTLPNLSPFCTRKRGEKKKKRIAFLYLFQITFLQFRFNFHTSQVGSLIKVYRRLRRWVHDFIFDFLLKSVWITLIKNLNCRQSNSFRIFFFVWFIWIKLVSIWYT